MIKTALVYLALVLYSMSKLASITAERSCEKRAYDLSLGCQGARDLAGCLRDLLSEMGGCDNAMQLLGLAEKEKPRSCEERAGEIKAKCQGTQSGMKCLLNEMALVGDCPEELKKLGLEGIDPKYVGMTCDEKANHLVSICTKTTGYIDCVEQKMPLLSGCQELGKFNDKKTEEGDLSQGWDEDTCRGIAEYLRITCGHHGRPKDMAQCTRDTISFMFDCREAERLLGTETSSETQ